jgi:alkylation response protein AidB-like acyl-CoA dehydrogenase
VDDPDSTSELLRDSAIAFFTGQAGSARLRGWIAKPRPVDRALWLAAAELGWTTLLLPESMGGSGLGLADAALLAEEAGRHLFAEPLVAAAVMPALLLAAAEHGPAPELVAELARVLADGQHVLTVAWQEAPGQLDLAMPTCEVIDGRLSGSKLFVPACEPDGVLLVWAQHGGEPAWVVVDAQAEGVQRSVEAAGLGSQATLRFDQTRLRDDGLVLRGDAAQRARHRMLAGGRLALAAELVGLATGALALALAHVRSRQQFGRTLGSFQAVQHRCVDLHMEVELARASLRQALVLFDARPDDADDRHIDAAICAAKARAGDTAVRVGRESVQLLGAMGFCDEVDAGLYLRAALHGNAWLGGPVALRRRFAAHLADSTMPMLEAVHD